MGQRLTSMAIDKVALVDRGANGREFAVLKRDEEGGVADLVIDPPPAGVLDWLRKRLGFEAPTAEPVVKVDTFADRVAGQELRDALYDSWYTLEDALWAAIYAYGADNQPLPLETKKALVGQSLDEFKAFLLVRMDSGIQKSEGAPADAASRAITAVIAKVGRKISGDRLERLNAAAEALNGVLAEVAEAVEDETAEEAEEDQVEKTELVAAITEAVTKAQEPLVARIEALETSGTSTSEDEQPATLDDVVEAIGKLADRVEAVEKSRGGRTSLPGQDAGEVEKKASRWAGVI